MREEEKCDDILPSHIFLLAKQKQKNVGQIAMDRSVLKSSALVLFQRLLNRLGHLFAFRNFFGFKAGDDLSVAVDQEFAEVPFDVAAEFGVGLLAGQEFVERVNVAAFDRDFGEHRERDFIFQ